MLRMFWMGVAGSGRRISAAQDPGMRDGSEGRAQGGFGGMWNVRPKSVARASNSARLCRPEWEGVLDCCVCHPWHVCSPDMISCAFSQIQCIAAPRQAGSFPADMILPVQPEPHAAPDRGQLALPSRVCWPLRLQTG